MFRPPAATPVILALALALGPVTGSGRAAGLEGAGLDVSAADAPAATAALARAAAMLSEGLAGSAVADHPAEERLLLRLSLAVGGGEPEDDAASLSAALEPAAGHARVIVALAEVDGPDVRDGAAVDAWVERVAMLAERGAGRVAAWELAGGARDDAEAAFFIKRTALAIKGVDRRTLVLAGDARAEAGGTLAESVGPFVDGLASATGSAGPAGGLRTGLSATDARGLLREALAARARGEHAAVVAVPSATLVTAPRAIGEALAIVLAALPPDVSPTGAAPRVSFPAEVDVEATQLVAASDLGSRLILEPRGEGRLPAGRMVVTFDDEPVDLRVFDADGPELRPRVARHGGGWGAEIPLVRRPIVLAWDRARGDEVAEDVGVDAVVDPTVDEILARHFAAQAARDHALHSYVADISTEMRYALGASGQSFDVRIEGRYFFDRAGVREIENLRWFINGARYEPKSRRVPELPLLQPEKVQALPLELRLDKTYDFRLEGRDARDGHQCWRVAFRPRVSDVTAYAGTVWIDSTTYDRVAVDLVQTQLEPPILSSEQSDRFGAVLADDGEHWLVRESRIQRTVSLLGGTVGVTMRMLYSNYRVNPPDFSELREAALRSDHQMMRDTDEGLRYLRTDDAGDRVVAETSSRKLFVAAGARYDDSYGGVLPLAGINWLDHDLGGRGLQMNIFAAGAINSFSIADPSVAGSRVAVGADVFLPVIRRRERQSIPGTGVDDAEVVRSRVPRIGIEISRPVGLRARIGATARVAHQSFSRADDTSDAFVIPQDGFVFSLGALADWRSGGWDLRSFVERSQRDGWQDWGLDDGSGPPPAGEAADGYWKWGASVSRFWPLTKLQTASLDVQYLGGSGLDRFSQHEFSAFGGTRLPGFDGSGILFDEAALVRVAYGAQVAGLFGAQLQVGFGRTWNRDLPDAVRAEFGKDSDHLGVALTGNLPGPKGTLIRFDVGTALVSTDHADAEGSLVAQVLVLKMIGR